MHLYIYSRANINSVNLSTVSLAYNSWNQIYQEELGRLSLSHQPESYWHSDYFLFIQDSTGEVVCGLGLSHFNLQLPNIHLASALAPFPLNLLQDFGKTHPRCLTFERLFVAPKFRGQRQTPWAEIIISCAYKFLEQSDYDGMLAVARSDRKIPEITKKFGSKLLGEIEKNNTPCTLLYTEKEALTEHPDPLIKKQILNLWKNVSTSLPLTTNKEKPMTNKDIIYAEVLKLQNCFESLPWQNEKFYAQYLAQTYFYVRNATRVLCKAAAQCTHEQEVLHKRLLQSMLEERNHEIMATNDIAELSLNTDISEFQEFPETTAYYQSLMAKIDQQGPYALLGYFVTLEGLGGIGADKILNWTLETYGKKCTQFLRVHIRVDEHHFHDGVDYILSLPADAQKIVMENVILSSRLFISLLERLKKESLCEAILVSA